MPLKPPTCPACKNPKPARLYLCRGCWFTLQPGVRAALNRRDDHAVRRLSDLYEQIRTDVPLREIRITT